MEAPTMDIETVESNLSRRELICGAGMLAALGVPQVQAATESGGAPNALTPEQLALEQANEALVNNFIRDYATRDVNVVASYLADDIIYQVSESQGEVIGIDAYKKRITSSFAGLAKVDWQVLRSFAIGQLVINERIDDFFPKPGSPVPRMQFRVSGYFLVVDNKIKIWRDFGYPGAKQLIEPASKA